MSISSHPSYGAVSWHCDRFPTQASALFQAYIDLQHAAGWEDLRPIELEAPTTLEGGSEADLIQRAFQGGSEGWAALRGSRKGARKQETIVPVLLSHQIHPKQFTNIFNLLAKQDDEQLEKDHILLAIMAQDSSLVYYKLSKGLVKPVN